MLDKSGLVYKMSRMGPSTEPWETPQERGAGHAVWQSTITIWVLSVK